MPALNVKSNFTVTPAGNLDFRIEDMNLVLVNVNVISVGEMSKRKKKKMSRRWEIGVKKSDWVSDPIRFYQGYLKISNLKPTWQTALVLTKLNLGNSDPEIGIRVACAILIDEHFSNKEGERDEAYLSFL